MKFLNHRLLLTIIFFLAVFLRFQNINTNPPHLNWDETALGYNAYSLSIDLRDEFGRFLPLDYLESFGDFKPVMYSYLDAIPIKIFGLTPFAVRFPSALIGSLTVLATYFLVLQLFYKSKDKYAIAAVSSLILAVSPWHIMLSRAAFEANIATFFIILGTYFFLVFVNRNKWAIILSAVFFVLSIYTFNTARVVAPLLVIVLSAVFLEKILTNKKQVAIAILLGVLMLLPIVRFLNSPQAALRFKEVNIFSDLSVIEISNKRIQNDNYSILSKVINNRRVLFAREYISHYLDNFSPNFLFIKGDGNPRFSTQDLGQLYLWDLPFLIAGLLFLFQKKEGHYYLIPLILLIGIIPAGTARETPHALRIENSLPYFQIIIAYGFWQIYKIIKQKRLFFVFAGILLATNALYFLHGLFTHYPREYSQEWQYQYKDSVSYVSQNKDKYDLISITNEVGRPYIYYLFFTKHNPSDFRKSAKIKRDAYGFVTVESFDKYYFSSNVLDVKKNGKILYIDIPGNVPKGAHVEKEFNLLSGKAGLVAYTL